MRLNKSLTLIGAASLVFLGSVAAPALADSPYWNNNNQQIQRRDAAQEYRQAQEQHRLREQQRLEAQRQQQQQRWSQEQQRLEAQRQQQQQRWSQEQQQRHEYRPDFSR